MFSKTIMLPLLLLLPLMCWGNTLQEAIDSAAPGSIIKLGRGVYPGPVLINKAITLTSEDGGAVIRGSGEGSVITVTANHAVVSNLIVEGSGDLHQTIDACVVAREVNNVKITGNTLRDCLFGVNFEQTNRSLIQSNTITSKPFSLGLRGDGIRLWYSHSNIIRGNTARFVRDNVFWYSSANRIEDNTGSDSRYSLHFMYADRNEVRFNRFQDNSVGVFLMYSQGSTVSGNTLVGASEKFGIGLGMKEVSDCIIEKNTILYNATGLYLDQSPLQPGTTNKFFENHFLYNAIAIQMHGTILGSLYEGNRFNGNIVDVDNDTPESKLSLNRWFQNRWDKYEGFDRNKDGYGDTPHEIHAYADQLWGHRPSARFFYAAPIISVINFMARLMPFSEPVLLATDPQPVVRKRNDD
ncbi:MAG: nitrous oxide reductase family maturation protein NosD [Burkholderiales bacterium]|jgi:nitrous oxidase accessory protein|nr:nitrous oxide reductase family maturation protein NosD [Burkholderiales bacterium]